MRNVAIIPARSGSKGLPDKNIKLLCGKPLISYSIEAAMESKMFDEVMVSTDSEKYAEIAELAGAKVPFLRSEYTSSDDASSWDVVDEVLEGYEKLGKCFDTFCLLQPTSPLRNADDIVQGYQLFCEKNAIAVISVSELDHPLEWCGKLDSSLSLNGFLRKNANQRQRTESAFRPNGAMFIASVLEFRNDHYLYREGSYAYIMPRERSVDIDTEYDFLFAKCLMDSRRER